MVMVSISVVDMFFGCCSQIKTWSGGSKQKKGIAQLLCLA